ncbi:unnamed protein product [Closterium sp. NIES-64]|nr:unnamed protein product [Closterium sp. NIES-64]
MPLFQPFRAIGYITDDTPFSVRRVGTETYVTVSVGRAWQIYNCAKLRLVFVGSELPKSIRALTSHRDRTFAAFGTDIAVFYRSHQVGTLKGHKAKIKLLLVFGEYLISVDENRHVLMWPVRGTQRDAPKGEGEEGKGKEGNEEEEGRGERGGPDGDGGVGNEEGKKPGGADQEGFVLEPLGQFQLPEGFNPTGVIHPDTYLNKLLFASEDGRMQLWNVNSRKLLYEFKGWGVGITALVGSPALDTVAVGCSDGKVHVHNIRLDRPVVDFTHAAAGAVTSLAFNSDGPPLLAVGGMGGAISVWDLTNRRLHSIIPDAHDGRVAALSFLVNEPLLLSAGADNSLKIWIFDSVDDNPRLLRYRTGHSSPPCCIKYYRNGRHILSAGLDRSFRIFSTVQDQQSRELSQGNFEKRMKKMMMKEEKLKLSKVVCIDAAEVRERDWANVVTCHEGNPAAFVWELRNFVIGKLRLVPPGIEPSPATVCAASMCGNFALVGTSSGHLHLFHLQSARHRVAYQSEKMQYSPAHGGMVTGAAIDALNRHSISCGRDGRVKVWYLKSGRLRFDVNVGSPIVKLKFHHGNNLAAIACENFTTYIFDAEAGRLVRRFPGHEDRITAVEVSPDGRWLLTSAMDLTVRTWHVVSGRPLDAFQVPTAVVGLSMSPTSDLLATIHLNRRGIYLWANKAMYSGIDDSDLLPAPLSLPAATATDGTGTNSSVPAVQMPILIGPNEGAEGEEEDEEGRRVGGRGVGTGDVAVIAGEGGGGRAGVSGGEGEVGRGKSEGGTRAEHWTAEEAEREARDYETSAAATAAAAAAAGGSGGGGAAAAAGENQQQNQELQLQVPGLISRAMLPRSQWVNLVMLDVIKERNRPIQPPKKPEQAPFFLPSVPTFSGAIHFAPPQAAAAVAAGSAEPAGSAGSAEPTGSTAAAADGVAGASGGSSGGALPGWGSEGDAEMEEGEEEEGEEGSEEGEEGGAEGEEGGERAEEGGKKGGVLGKRRHGRVMRGGLEDSEMDTELMRAIRRGAQCDPADCLEDSEMDTELMRAIRRGAQSESADYSQATALLKVMSPSAVDLELRAIEIVDDSPSPADLHRVALFMSFLEGKLRGSCDFELLQAVTHRFLAIHGSAISSFPQLRAKLPALKEAQASSWQRLDELFQSIRCVVDFIASS